MHGQNKQATVFRRVSPRTFKENEVTMMVDPDDYMRWLGGELIQRAMPYLTPDEREFLMTGFTPEDWEAMFGGGEEQAGNDEEQEG